MQLLIINTLLDRATGKHIASNHKDAYYPKPNQASDKDNLDIKFFKKAFTEKQKLEQKKNLEVVNQKISDSLRDLCLPKLLCEIAAKPIYLLSDKEKHVLSLLK